MQYLGHKLYKVYINDGSGLTLADVTVRSNWVAFEQVENPAANDQIYRKCIFLKTDLGLYCRVTGGD